MIKLKLKHKTTEIENTIRIERKKIENITSHKILTNYTIKTIIN
jgi:hypothetical protein